MYKQYSLFLSLPPVFPSCPFLLSLLPVLFPCLSLLSLCWFRQLPLSLLSIRTSCLSCLSLSPISHFLFPPSYLSSTPSLFLPDAFLIHQNHAYTCLASPLRLPPRGYLPMIKNTAPHTAASHPASGTVLGDLGGQFTTRC